MSKYSANLNLNVVNLLSNGEDPIDSMDQLLQQKRLHDGSCSFSDITQLKKFKVDLGAADDNTTTTFVFDQSVDRSINVPDVNDTLIVKDAVQTITHKDMSSATNTFPAFITASSTNTFQNKKLEDATCSVVDDGDNTKALKFSLGGATTGKTMTIISSHGNNRSITLPDSDNTLSTLAGVESLTNKTIVAPTISSPQISGVIQSTDTTNSTNTSTGAITTLGGIGVAKDVSCANLTTGVLDSTDTTNSSNTSTGAIITSGGIGVAKDIHCANLGATNLNATGSITCGSVLSDAMITATVDTLTLSDGNNDPTRDFIVNMTPSKDNAFTTGGSVTVNLGDSSHTIVTTYGSGTTVTDSEGWKFNANGTQFKETRFGTHTFTTPNLASQANTSASISFSPAFNTTPKVFLTVDNNSGSLLDALTLSTKNIATSGFDMYIKNVASSGTTTGSPIVHWFAIG